MVFAVRVSEGAASSLKILQRDNNYVLARSNASNYLSLSLLLLLATVLAFVTLVISAGKISWPADGNQVVYEGCHE